MRGVYTNGITFNAGHVNLKPNRLCHIVKATGVVHYAYDEDNVNCISIGDEALYVNDPVSVLMLPAFNRSFWVSVLDAGARGANLYLDVQADQASATGLLKFTAGTATKVIAVADDVITTALATGNIIPAYQTNLLNNVAVQA